MGVIPKIEYIFNKHVRQKILAGDIRFEINDTEALMYLLCRLFGLPEGAQISFDDVESNISAITENYKHYMPFYIVCINNIRFDYNTLLNVLTDLMHVYRLSGRTVPPALENLHNELLNYLKPKFVYQDR